MKTPKCEVKGCGRIAGNGLFATMKVCDRHYYTLRHPDKSGGRWMKGLKPNYVKGIKGRWKRKELQEARQ